MAYFKKPNILGLFVTKMEAIYAVRRDLLFTNGNGMKMLLVIENERKMN